MQHQRSILLLFDTDNDNCLLIALGFEDNGARTHLEELKKVNIFNPRPESATTKRLVEQNLTEN